MTDTVDLGPEDLLGDGEAMRIPAEQTGYPEDIALVRSEDGDYFAVDDECTHAAVSLSDGFVEEDTIECPMHASAFCLRTGVPETPPAITPVKTHHVTVENGRVILHPGVPRSEAPGQ
ncbi:non-heme iron oxygenase ferredoxin subunit [Nesterenkonia alba]|uniref:non-heme iron oxygenase ferredoxin subunit n=1 Tax=Nesterenkonia alba TaxID=515814 RepID=UPI0003B4225A|nr:non-heme iron oxygenase ferredoxin subunit [Nesterenkonia alba]